MKVKLRTLYCGPRGSFQPGQVVDFDEAHAKELIAAGYAVAGGPAPVPRPAPVEVETAVLAPQRTAVHPKPARKRRGS